MKQYNKHVIVNIQEEELHLENWRKKFICTTGIFHQNSGKVMFTSVCLV